MLGNRQEEMPTTREDESNRRQPTRGDPWPGGSTMARWPCWCTKCKGEHIHSRHIRDKHMFKDGVYTTTGVSPCYLCSSSLSHTEIANQAVESALKMRNSVECECGGAVRLFVGVKCEPDDL